MLGIGRQDIKDDLPLHIRSLYRYALALTRNQDEAHDLVQDCCLTALDKQDLFRAGSNLRAWLFAIMHNRHVSGLRKKAARPRLVEASEALTAAHPSAQMARLEFRDLVSALDAIGEEFREVLVLVTVEGLSYREVSEVLDVPVGTVTSRLSRARRMLRDFMEHGTAAPPDPGGSVALSLHNGTRRNGLDRGDERSGARAGSRGNGIADGRVTEDGEHEDGDDSPGDDGAGSGETEGESGPDARALGARPGRLRVVT